MDLVVSDSSTLIHLAAIGRLALLKTFYGGVTIPPAVWREVAEEGAGRAGAGEVDRARRDRWVKVSAPADQSLIRLLMRDLDDGEAEVIALAVERQADLVLVDETEARRIADLYGLRKTGIVGILIRARREGMIERLRPELDRLRGPGGFWIEEALYQQALAVVDEADRPNATSRS